MTHFHHASHPPRKRFGQHFLTDHAILQKIIRAINPKKEDHLVEIGPGQGALTHYLLPLVHRLDLVEIDRDLVSQLHHQFPNENQISIHQADALEFHFSKISQQKKSLRVVGNLPYNISTPLLFHLFEELTFIKDMHFMLQKEVVLRLTAPIGSHDYGRLSVMAQYYCKNKLLFSVPPQAFYPKPKVESAFIVMQPHEKPLLKANNLKIFTDVVREAFNYRRKTLANSLKRLISSEDLQSLNLDPHLRPQNLSPEDYVRISNLLNH